MEKPNHKGDNNFVVGLFVFVGVLVGAGFVVFMGGLSLFNSEIRVKSLFGDVRGLNVGAPVFLTGIQVGRVAGFEFPKEGTGMVNGKPGVMTSFSIEKRYADRIQRDAQVSVTTQGVLGDKVIAVIPGTPGEATVTDGTELPAQQAKELSDMFAKGGNMVDTLAELSMTLNKLVKSIESSGRIDSILVNLDRTSASMANLSQNLSQSSKEDIGPALKDLRKILAKIDRGEGTLGALINDPGLHEDLRILLGGAKRSQAVRFLLRQAISGAESGAGTGAASATK